MTKKSECANKFNGIYSPAYETRLLTNTNSLDELGQNGIDRLGLHHNAAP